MTASLEELLQQVRGRMLRAGRHEIAAGVTGLIAASVALDELNAAVRREDEEAVAFHAELLARLLADVGTSGFPPP
ncbi:hypothetical protein SAMN05216188_111271 [Lentzea xinjiangensis]|uniref:Uncharacterized protein n=1 Tax=Lentzea xinjiangensis TaxID=402600 RepID=A0A1H9PDW9_9PSEU|nr:hypothetical protein [Lentzea xinjiangensis]SER46426.1 hypothetical protein SAMN05216188_111271 [Lentzea xinjiangensis]